MTYEIKTAVVLGAGVVGLTTALLLQETGKYKVTIIADTFPTDPLSIRYTSLWAGAHHDSLFTEDPKRREFEPETFHKLWELSAPGGAAEHCLLRMEQKKWFDNEVGEPYFSYPQLRRLSTEELIPGSVAGFSFQTVSIDSPKYLNWLLSQFLAKGGSILRASVQHLSQVIEGGPSIFEPGKGVSSPPDAIVVAVGLGARFLGGVEDKAVYPIRGETVVVKAPWINFCRTFNGKVSYIIPRRSGEVILGGTKDADDWYPVSRPEIKQKILENALELAPELVPESSRAGRSPTVDDLVPLIVNHGPGLRPGRKGGIRIEVEHTKTKASGKSIPVVFNYGHGGFGYQSSWGSARAAVELVERSV